MQRRRAGGRRTSLALSLVAATAWRAAATGPEWGALCRGEDQSPIDIEPFNVEPSDLQVRLRYSPWALKDVHVAASRSGFVSRLLFKEGRSPGYVQVGTANNDFDEYALTSIEVHSPSEHTFRHASWPVELQLWHTPRSLVRISQLGEDAKALANRSARAEADSAGLDNLAKQLVAEARGETSPWGDSSAQMREVVDGMAVLDWVDQTKRDAIAELKRMREDVASEVRVAQSMVEAMKATIRAQRRPNGSAQMVISILIQQAPASDTEEEDRQEQTSSRGSVAAGSDLIRWVAKALEEGGASGEAAPARGELNAEEVLLKAKSGSELYAYRGSLTRPPCTPNVRWFVTAQPHAARREDIELLLRSATSGRGGAAPGVLGAGRDIQPIGPSRSLQRVRLSGEAFSAPALPLVPEGEQKWALVARYGKVFLLCALLLSLSPPLLWVARRVAARLHDPDESPEGSKLAEAAW